MVSPYGIIIVQADEVLSQAWVIRNVHGVIQVQEPFPYGPSPASLLFLLLRSDPRIFLLQIYKQVSEIIRGLYVIGLVSPGSLLYGTLRKKEL
jgi:hypothetical protein